MSNSVRKTFHPFFGVCMFVEIYFHSYGIENFKSCWFLLSLRDFRFVRLLSFYYYCSCFFFLFEVQSPSSLPTLWSRRVRDMFSTQSRCWGIREESRASVRCLSWILLHQQVCKLWKQKARSFPYCILPWENLIHITYSHKKLFSVRWHTAETGLDSR